MNLWEEILTRIETKVNKHSFYTWFKPTAYVTEDLTSVTVRVPNTVFKDWLTKNYSGVISEAMDELRRPNVSVKFVAEPQTEIGALQLSADEAAALESETTLSAPGPLGLNPRYTF